MKYTIGIGVLFDESTHNLIRDIELRLAKETKNFAGLGQPPHVTVKRPFDVDKIKDSSQAAKSKFSPWNSGYYDEMAKKTVLRRLWKLLPSSIEFRDIHTDEKILTPDNFKNGEADLNTIEADFNFEPISETEKVNTETGEIETINFEDK